MKSVYLGKKQIIILAGILLSIVTIIFVVLVCVYGRESSKENNSPKTSEKIKDVNELINEYLGEYEIESSLNSQESLINKEESINETDTTIQQDNESVSDKKYGIELDKSSFEYDSYENCYYMMNICDSFSGIIENSENVNNAKITITNAVGKIVLERQIEVKKEFVVKQAGLLIGENNIVLYAEYNDGKVISEQIKVYSTKEESMKYLDIDFKDNDNDGLINFLEEMYGTNLEKEDSDGDGINDYEELTGLGYDPNKVDSDGNGVSDGDEDIDGDGLTNIEEIRYGTSNYTRDTDGDLIDDYTQIKNGTDPNVEDLLEANREDEKENTDNYFSGKTEDIFIELKYIGKNIKNITLETNDGYDFFYNDWYICQPFNISTDGTFASGKIKVEFYEVFLTMEGLIPKLYYMSENEFVEINTKWDGTNNYVTAVIYELGTYVLVDDAKFDLK